MTRRDIVCTGIAITVLIIGIILNGRRVPPSPNVPPRNASGDFPRPDTTATPAPPTVAAAPEAEPASNSDSGDVIPVNPGPPDLQVLDTHAWENDDGSAAITGYVQNNTFMRYGYVEVQINLYNEGVLVGSEMTNVLNLEAHTQWAFRIPTDRTFTHFKIMKVEGQR